MKTIKYYEEQSILDALHRYFSDGFEEDRFWNSTHVMWALRDAPVADVISVRVFIQVRQERDIAVEQLRKLGYELGEKVTPIVRCKDCLYGTQDKRGWWFCRDLGCRMGNPETGDGFCSDGERDDGDENEAD